MNDASQPPESYFERRLWLASAVIAIVFGLFLVRLFQLQVLQGEALSRSSERNFIHTVKLPAPRGEILDRDERVLATTRLARHVDVVANELRRSPSSYALLGSLLDTDAEQLRRQVQARRGRARFQPLRIAEDLPFRRLAAVESHGHFLPGVFTEVRPRRFYPGGSAAAHLLGTLGEIRADQLAARRESGYRAGDEVGQSGVEALFETFLHGRAGGKNAIVDVMGREVQLLNEVPPQPGGRVELTLDLDLQRVAEEAMRSDDGVGLRSGAVVALDPRNGDILVMLSAPAFDPNDFAAGVDTAVWRHLNEDPARPLQNRAVSGQYPPGSTYKAIVAAAALEEGEVTTADRVFCPGHFRYGNRSYNCWKRGGHGWVAFQDALRVSCDVYFYRAGLALGVDRLAKYAEAFGLGRPTGIALEGEARGLIPTRRWKERRHGELWQPGETVSISIGQGYNLVTPLQLATAYAAIANGGELLKPRLVQARVSRDGRLHAGDRREVRWRIPVTAAHLEQVRDALVAVVEAPGGTGRRARVTDLVVAGKTGTSQVVSRERLQGLREEEIPRRFQDHALFAAFAPADAPALVVAVILEHGGGGGANAAPIAQRILARWFEKYGTAKAANAAGTDDAS